MKKNLTRILSALLVALMLIPALITFAASAEEATTDALNIDDIVNAYKLKALDSSPNMEKKDGDTIPENGVLASEPFDVTANGDKYIYVGPCPEPTDSNYNDLILYWYKKDGSYYGAKKMGELKGDVADGGNIVDRFPNGSVILRIRVNQKTHQKFAAIRVPTTYADCMLVTVERPFTVEEYFAYADSQGWAIDGTLRPFPPVMAEEAPDGYEGLWNLFPRKEESNSSLTQEEAANAFQMSGYIPVQEGDTITFGAAKSKETRNILYTYTDELIVSDFKEIRQYKRTDIGIDFVEDLGYDYGIYSYVVPQGVSYVRVCTRLGVYNNGDTFVTRNQPFTGAQMREALEIAELSNEAKAHPFYGKKALFVGDSISYGSYDTPSSYSIPAAGLARRLAFATGLIPTNISYSGVTVGKTGLRNAITEYDLLKTVLITKKNYDMVVFQGGINDALKNVPAGEALPADTDRKVLLEDDRLATFAGGLQLMFHDAKIKWQDAELYYIADYKVVANATGGKDMAEYYAQAKALCDAYGVHYIDLYNNVELDYANTELFAENALTPTSAAYDVLFPTVLRLFNETVESSKVVVEQTASAEAAPTQMTPVKMSVNQSPTDTNDNADEANCCKEVSGWKAFWNSIANFFRRLFGQCEVCICGEVIAKVK